MSLCRNCLCALEIGGNWSLALAKKQNHICTICSKIERRARYLMNKPKALAQARDYYSKNWQAEAAKRKTWKFRVGENPSKRRARNAKRRHVVREALCETASEEKITAIYNMAHRLTKLTGTVYHVDHLVPVSRGGKHHEDNLVVMRADFNMKKHSKIIQKWIAFFGTYRCKENYSENFGIFDACSRRDDGCNINITSSIT